MINRDILFLKHILESCENIISFTLEIKIQSFAKSRLIQSGVIRELTIIGEATKNLSKEIRNKYKNIPWRKIAGMKDKLTHGYFTVDLKEVWNTAKNDIPALKNNLREIFKAENIE